VEVRHSRNRRQSAKGIAWSTFVANYCCREALQLTRRIDGWKAAGAAESAGVPAAKKRGAETQQRTLLHMAKYARRRLTVQDLMRFRVVGELQVRRRAGETAVNPASRALWEAAKLRLQTMTEGEAAELRDLASLSELAATANRAAASAEKTQLMSHPLAQAEGHLHSLGGQGEGIHALLRFPATELRETGVALGQVSTASSSSPRDPVAKSGGLAVSICSTHPLSTTKLGYYIAEKGGSVRTASNFKSQCRHLPVATDGSGPLFEAAAASGRRQLASECQEWHRAAMPPSVGHLQSLFREATRRVASGPDVELPALLAATVGASEEMCLVNIANATSMY
jgi:hypothetical protein